MTTSPYQLAEDVFLCQANNRIVFLDLRRNQYLCLNRCNTQTVISLLSGSTEPSVEPLRDKRATENEDIRLIVQALTDRGLLDQSGTNRMRTSVDIRTPENVLFADGSGQKPVVRSGHWVVFFHASFKASWKLRWFSMQQTVRSIENRKRHCVKLQTTDHDALRELVSIFHHLRPFYARKYLCLYDSLALVEFLAHFHLFPQWVFGVTAEPFNAHCWVQEGNCVLNDTVEYVRGFTPIMAV